MGSKSKAPPQVDTAALAQQQGAANKETGLQNWLLGTVNQETPYGTQERIKTGPGDTDYTIRQTLNPQDQQRLDMSRALEGAYLGLGQGLMPQVQAALSKGVDTSGLPALSGIGMGPAFNKVDPNMAGNAGVPGVNYNSATPSGMTWGIGGGDDALRTKVEDASYNKLMSRLDPAFERQQSALQARQANMGGVTTSSAARQQMSDLLQGQGDARQQAAMEAILQGGNQAQQAQAMEKTAGDFRNTAQGQDFTQQIQMLQQANQAQGQGFGQKSQTLQDMLSALGFNNQADQQAFGNAMAGTQLNNQVRGQGIQEQSSLANIPINQLMAMLSGTQVNPLQFGQTQQGGIAPTPYMQAGQMQIGQNTAAQQAAMGSGNSMMGALGTLGAAGITAF